MEEVPLRELLLKMLFIVLWLPEFVLLVGTVGAGLVAKLGRRPEGGRRIFGFVVAFGMTGLASKAVLVPVVAVMSAPMDASGKTLVYIGGYGLAASGLLTARRAAFRLLVRCLGRLGNLYGESEIDAAGRAGLTALAVLYMFVPPIALLVFALG
jgi:hypothetical protein